MLRKFKPLIDAGKLETLISDGRMGLVLPTDVLFASGSAKLSKDGAGAVKEVGGALAEMDKRRFPKNSLIPDPPPHSPFIASALK